MSPDAIADTLSAHERERYARHLSLEGFGEEAQLRLRRSTVLVIGAGGLGSPALMYLAAAGVGHIIVADADRVDTGNLQRQIIHTTASVGLPKVHSAARAMRAINPCIEVEPVEARLDASTLPPLVARADFVIDATDNFDSRFLINDTCVELSTPFCHGSISGWSGQVMTWLPGHACYRCLFNSPPAAPEGPAAGPVGFLPGIVGTIQAGEAIRHLSATGTLLTDTLLVIDTLTMATTRLALSRDPRCPACKKIITPQ